MVRRNRDEMLALVQEWQTSGQSRKVFSQERGIPYTTFYSWCCKAISQPDETSATAAMQIVQVGSINFSIKRREDSGVHLRVGSVNVELDSNFSSQALARVLEVIKQC